MAAEATTQPTLRIGDVAFELPVNDEQLWEFVATVLGVEIPRIKVCPDHVAPFTAFADAYFARHPVMLWQGSRGLAGKTYLLAALAWMEQVLLGAGVSLLGGSGAQSQNVHRYINRFWSRPYAPRGLLVNGQPGQYLTELTTGGFCKALMASQASVRGPHPHRLRLDEVDEMAWEILEAALGQPMEGGERIPVQTVMSSTHQHPDGTWTRVKRQAAERGQPVYRWCWRETIQPHGWLTTEQVAQTRATMTAVAWDVEVEQREPSAQDRAITPEAVERMFDPAYGEADGALGADLEFELPVPVGVYATGADWGKKLHYSAIVTFRLDCTPARIVALWRDRRKPYSVMAPVLNRRLQRFPGKGVHDSAGVGEAVGEHLTLPVEGYDQWVGKARHVLFNEYIAAVEQGKLVGPRVEPWYLAHKYLTNGDLFEGGHPPDEIVACALAWRARPPYLTFTDTPVLQSGGRTAPTAMRSSTDAAAPPVATGAARGGLIL